MKSDRVLGYAFIQGIRDPSSVTIIWGMTRPKNVT